VDNTRFAAYSAVTMNGMRLVDQWLCDESQHVTTNKQYFAKYKRFSVPTNISLADKGSTMASGSGCVNVEMLVQGKW